MSAYGLDDLVGRRLVSVVFDPAHNDRIAFVCADATLVYRAEGDCCSSSWIEHLTVPNDLAPGVPIAEVKEYPQMDDRPNDWETVTTYQTALVTPKGEVIIEYRNSSNGYYGGWLERVS